MDCMPLNDRIRVSIPKMHLPVLFHLRRLNFAGTISGDNLEISLKELTSDFS